MSCGDVRRHVPAPFQSGRSILMEIGFAGEQTADVLRGAGLGREL